MKHYINKHIVLGIISSFIWTICLFSFGQYVCFHIQYYHIIALHNLFISELLIGTMVPLQKDKRKAHHSSDNYRALTLGSIIGKLYDAIIIKQQTRVFDTSDLRFGLKDVYFYVKETISYHVNNGSAVHVLLLDASKAFDRVNYCMLFQKLIDEGMCPLIV